MQSLLDIIHDYQGLRGRRALGVPLSAEEQRELVALTRLLRGPMADPHRRRRLHRLACSLDVQFTLPGGFGHGKAKNISGGGMAVHTRSVLPVGTRMLVHVRDVHGLHEHTFPARVVWRSLAGMGLSFDGVPSKAEIYGPSGGDFPSRRTRRKTPLVA